jgi:hypothetical protein
MSRSRASVALFQLPILDPDPDLARANVPLAAGTLKAAATKAAVLKGTAGAAAGAAPAGQSPTSGVEEVRIHLPPRELMNHGGEEALLAWLEEGNFDLVGFTTYLWNLERSLWLARALKQRTPHARVIFGGPEIVAGQPILDSPAVDAFVLGEGERSFLSALADLTGSRGLKRRYSGGEPADLRELPNPYLSGALEMRADEAVYLETMRGCPYRCSYCFYGKLSPTVRSYSDSLLPELFDRARAAAVPEIYFMDPSFNATAGLAGRLRRIASLNRTGIPLHTEIRLESVGPEIAPLLAEAGFVSVEVGLQSTNPRALRAIRRHWNRERFLQGAELLRRQGLRFRIGIILGLPWDGLPELEATLSFLIDNGLTSGLEVYPLSLLPGTELRDRAEELGIRYMDLPPYWALSTNRLSEAELLQAVRLVEERLDAELFPPIVPVFRDPAPGLVGYLDVRSPGSVRRLLGTAPRLATSVTLHIGGAQLLRSSVIAELETLASWLRGTHPFTLVQLVIDGQEIPPWEPARRLAERLRSPGHLFERSRSLQADLQGCFSARLVHLTASPAAARRYYESPVPFDLMLRYSPALLDSHPYLLHEHPLVLADSALSLVEREKLASLYRGFEKLIVYR